MAMKICEDCINCGRCREECPYDAIEEAGIEWYDAEGNIQDPISSDHYFINPCKCCQCGKCAKACPLENIKDIED